METCFNYCDKDSAFFSSDERKWINKIHKLKEKHPDEIEILAEPENNDGCIYCKLPAAYFKLQPKTTRVMTDTQKAELQERLAKGRKDKLP